MTSLILLQNTCRCWVLLILLLRRYLSKRRVLALRMWTVDRGMCFSFWCGSLSFIFGKPVCAGWQDYNSCGSYWTGSAGLVINNPENTYCICMTLKAFLAVDSKRKWNLGPRKKENTSYIQLRPEDRHVIFLIKTKAVEWSVAQKHAIVRAEQDSSALSGMLELVEVRGMRNFMFCLLFKFAIQYHRITEL